MTEPSERVSVDSKAKAHAFLKLLRCRSVVCFLFFMLDVLAPLRRLSLQLQDRTCVIAQQHATLASVLEVIRKYKMRYANEDNVNMLKMYLNVASTFKHHMLFLVW